jgi:pyridoxal phosphate enzyme (YggS family)
MSVSKNIADVQEKIRAAARRSEREPEEITLMAVSKTFSAPEISEAYRAGLRVFGESKVQEFSGKVALLEDLRDARWHMIGHLQTNKAGKATELFTSVDSVDSVRLAEKLNIAAGQAKKKLTILIEINVGGEAGKSGIAPDSPELQNILQAAGRLEHLEIRGLMTVPPFSENPENARPFFRTLRELRRQIAAQRLRAVSVDILSMGMSHDFEVAIEEGSTCVRVGTAIFGGRIKT